MSVGGHAEFKLSHGSLKKGRGHPYYAAFYKPKDGPQKEIPHPAVVLNCPRT